MPSTYMSYEFSPADTADEKRRKLYLGIISIGEQCYTLGAAIAELRKQLDECDRIVRQLAKDFQIYKVENPYDR